MDKNTSLINKTKKGYLLINYIDKVWDDVIKKTINFVVIKVILSLSNGDYFLVTSKSRKFYSLRIRNFHDPL